MRLRTLLTAVTGCAAILVLAGPSAPKISAIGPITIDCDRDCLEDLATQYLNALVAHDPPRSTL